MSKRRIATGIDIGTHQIKVVMLEEVPQKGVQVIGVGSAPASGMRHGYVVDIADVATALKTAKRQAEVMARVHIKNGFLAIGGVSLDEARTTGSSAIARGDLEITDLDIEKVEESARLLADPQFLNRQVLHTIPLEYRVDGAKSLGNPIGFKGNRLEGDYLFVSCLSQHIDALTQVAESADIDILDYMASPLAGSYVTLSKDQKMKGCVLANIGAETVSIVVYDENVPFSIKVFPAGGALITDELALGFKVSLEDAERIKMGRLSGGDYPKKKVDDIITTKFRAMFDVVDKHLRAINKRSALPAGIVLSGGGANISSALDIARATLSLPARIAELQVAPESKMKDASWAVAYGVALWGLTGDTEVPKKSPFRGAGKALGKFLSQFLP